MTGSTRSSIWRSRFTADSGLAAVLALLVLFAAIRAVDMLGPGGLGDRVPRRLQPDLNLVIFSTLW